MKKEKNTKKLLFEMMEKVNSDYKKPESLNEEQTSEKKSLNENVNEEEKWQQDAVKEKGALHKELGIPQDEKIPMELINKQLTDLSAKAKGDNKLSATELKKLRRLNLAKTFKKQQNEEAESQNDDLIPYEIPEWALSALINGDYSGLTDDDVTQLKGFENNVANMYGNAEFILGDIEGKDNLGFRPSNDVNMLGSNVYLLYIKPTKGHLPPMEENNEEEIDPNDPTGTNIDFEAEKQAYITKADNIKGVIDKLLVDQEFEAIDSLHRLMVKGGNKVDEHHSPEYAEKAENIKGKIDFLFDNDHYDILDKIDELINKMYPINDIEGEIE